MSYHPIAQPRADRYLVSADEYRAYQRDGYLVVPGLVDRAETARLREHGMDILEGRVTLPGVAPPPPGAQQRELLERFTRVHMLHRVDPLCEQALLQPRVLDVLEVLIGPDVLALQTMLFYNPPGLGGQGWHQDAYYITTYPDTLIGAWIALERADEANGCLWVAPGSGTEPIHPDEPRGSLMHADGAMQGLTLAEHVSHLDDDVNTLSPVARQYGWKPAIVAEGDVIFFQGHLLHRSYPNRSETRWRRAFVSHYCNARSWVPWNHGAPFEGDAANAQHILARGTTHLPFAQPLFGTPCAATAPRPAPAAGEVPARMMPDGDDMMVPTSAAPAADDHGVNAWDPGEAWRSKV